MGRAGRGLAAAAAALALSAPANAAPVDIFYEHATNQLVLRVDAGISVGYVSLAMDGATSFVLHPAAQVSTADSVLDPTGGFMIIVSPYLVPMVPAGAMTSLGTLLFAGPIPACGLPGGRPCVAIREDLDLLGPAVLDIYGNVIPSSIRVPEPSLLVLLGLGLCGLLAARLGRAGRGLAVAAAALSLSAPANAAPVDIFLQPGTNTLYLRVDAGIFVGYLSLAIDGATGFTPAPTANISIADSILDPTDGFVIIVSPYGYPLVPAGSNTAVGTFAFVIPPCSSCTVIREDVDNLGPAVLDVTGREVASSIGVLPEPSAFVVSGLAIAALTLSRLAAARTAASAPPLRWPRAA